MPIKIINKSNNTNYIIILAREGSKRIKDKNLRKINGNSLVSKKIYNAIKSGIGEVFLSTNSTKIKKIGSKYKINIIERPRLYSSSVATTFSSILHFLRFLKKKKIKFPDYLTVLPPTFPFLKITSIRRCFKRLTNNKKFNSISSYTHSKVHPFTMVIENKNKLLFDKIKFLNYKHKNFERTQDWPHTYNNVAAIRISKINYFLKFLNRKSYKYINFTIDKKSCMGFKISSKESLDINNFEDLKKARKIKE